MLTVVIAEKKNIDSFRDYSLFLKPFMNQTHIDFCEWDPSEKTFGSAVRGLAGLVGQNRHWRAVVLCDESHIDQRNPFEAVKYRPTGAAAEDLSAKLEAYGQAAQQPLTRLMTWLNADPSFSPVKSGGQADRLNREAQESEYGNAAQTDEADAYGQYLREMERKAELRAEIRADSPEILSMELPEEILCIALRTRNAEKERPDEFWEPHEEEEYSRFYDWNMYFDRMRYLVFDILPKTHNRYAADRFRFLYTVILLVSNRIPGGSLRPNRVYNLVTENDEKAFSELLSSYDGKLRVTAEALEEMKEKERAGAHSRKPLTDKEMESIFTSGMHVPVDVRNNVDQDALTISLRRFGLSNGCPSDEYGVWQAGYESAKKELKHFEKQPKRIMNQSARDMRLLDTADMERVYRLSEFQVEDLKEHIGREELAMAETLPSMGWDFGKMDESLAESDRTVQAKIRTRMSRKRTLAIGILMLALFVLGSIPSVRYIADPGDGLQRLIVVIAVSAAVLAAAGIICLLFLRQDLTESVADFNRKVRGFSEEIEELPRSAGVYLNHACSVMRGFSALNVLRERPCPEGEKIRVFNKHLEDVNVRRAELRDLFGEYIQPLSRDDARSLQPYPYNYEIPLDYAYPVPYTEDMQRSIEFIERGVRVTVPVDFVRRITVEREELYDD